jgi:choline dehydrogenase-like flavoprotein
VVKHPSIAPKFVRQIYPPFEVETDEDVWDAIAAGSLTFHHPVRNRPLLPLSVSGGHHTNSHFYLQLGTVALGKVVQGKTFRIKGLQGIRVIDSSSIPTMPTSHLMAPTYAYAYYAAQKIKEQDRYI